MKKKTSKSSKSKTTKKILKKQAPKGKKKTITPKPEKPIGVVTHFYAKIKVGVVKFRANTKVGTKIQLRGASTDFKDALSSMQYDHKAVKLAAKGKSVGVKFKKRVREGDLIYVDKGK